MRCQGYFLKLLWGRGCVGWRAIFFINNKKKKATENYKQGFSYGLKSGRSPPQIKDLIQFEDDLVRIVKELKFAKERIIFKKILRQDMKQTSMKTLTPADRTSIKTTYKKPNRTLKQKSTKKVSNSQNKQIY